jgi:hypothetical protein
VLEEAGFIPLEPGAMVYLFVDVKEARPILDSIPIREMDPKQSKQMLDYTRSAVGALYPAESGRRFQLASWGKYPSGSAGMGFGASKDWKKVRSPLGPYWYSAPSGISISLTAKQAYVSASLTGSPSDPFSAAPGIEIPEDFGEFRRGAALSCWLEQPGNRVNQLFEAMELPLQLPAERIYVSLFSVKEAEPEAADQYEALIKIRTPSVSQARALITLISMARIFAPGLSEADGSAVLASALFANPPVQDGQNLNIKTAALSEKEIALLFSLFSVYSDKL